MPAPMVAAIEGLESVLREMVNNSKITNTLDKEISKALGLLLDLVLLPFLPLLVGALITLYTAIMTFGRLWGDFWKSKEIKSLTDALTALTTPIETVLKKLFPSLFPEEKSLIPEGETGAGLPKPFRVPESAYEKTTKMITDILKWAEDWANLMGRIVTGLLNLANDFIKGLIELAIGTLIFIAAVFRDAWLEFQKWIVDKARSGLSFISEVFNSWINGIVANFNRFVDNFFKLLDSLTWENLKTSFWNFINGLNFDNLVTGFKTFVNTIIDMVNDAIKNLTFGVGPKIPHLATGGTVSETGLAVVHKGETITPAGQGGITVIINGTYQNDEDLYRKFIDRLRTDQWRQNV